MNVLPSELLSSIATFLDLEDIKVIRLVSKSLARCSFDAFRYYLQRKEISLSVETLQLLIKKLQDDTLACYLEELVLTGEKIEQGPKVLKLLGTTLLLIKTQGKSLSLGVETSQTGLVIILIALQVIRLPLRKLVLDRNGGCHTSPISCYSPNRGLAPCLENVTEFSWSLTTDPNRPVKRSENIATIKEILHLLQNVERLELLWFWKARQRGPEDHFEKCFESILAMRQLKECTLRGIFVEERVLESFLQRTTITKIFLQFIRLRNGSFHTILDIVTSGKFDQFVLDDLHEMLDPGYCMIVFEASEISKPGSCHDGIKSSFISRKGEDVCTSLSYSYAIGEDFMGPNTEAYYERMSTIYGLA